MKKANDAKLSRSSEVVGIAYKNLLLQTHSLDMNDIIIKYSWIIEIVFISVAEFVLMNVLEKFLVEHWSIKTKLEVAQQLHHSMAKVCVPSHVRRRYDSMMMMMMTP